MRVTSTYFTAVIHTNMNNERNVKQNQQQQQQQQENVYRNPHS